MKFRILRDATPTDGNGPAPTPGTPPATPTPAPKVETPPPPPPAPGPDPGPRLNNPAAVVVTTGERTEKEIELQNEIDVLRAEKSTTVSQKTKLETDIAYLQDKLAALAGLKPTPTPKTPAKSEDHWTNNFGL